MLICDKRRPRMRGDTHQAPPRGPNKDSPPASGPRLRRSPRGRHAPDPPGLRPLARLRAPGPCCLGHPAGGGSGHGCDGGGGGQPLAVVHARRLAPWRFSGFWRNSAWAVPWHGGGSGACPRCRAAVGNPAQAVGGQGAAACGCARRPRTGRGCPRATGLQGTPVW